MPPKGESRFVSLPTANSIEPIRNSRFIDSKNNIEVRMIDFGKIGGGGIQHSKFFIVDGEQVFFGSQNFDWRALKHIHEIGVRIHHRQAASAYLDIFNLDWQLCQVDNPEEALQAVVPKEYPVPFCLLPEGEDPVEFYPVWLPKSFHRTKISGLLQRFLN